MIVVAVWYHECSSRRLRHSGPGRECAGDGRRVARRAGVGACADADAAAAGWQCATFKAPSDYSIPAAAPSRSPSRACRPGQAHRIGALFINSAGRAAARSTSRRARPTCSAPFNDHFDIVAFDPRGTGGSSPAIDCKVNQETDGLYSAPFTTPENLDVNALVAQGQGPT